MNYVLNEDFILAITFTDPVTNVKSIATLEKGGPIINGTDSLATKNTFEAAFKLSCAVRNLLFFKMVNESQKIVAKPVIRQRNWSKVNNQQFVYQELEM